MIQGVQVSAPFGNVKYALEVFEVAAGVCRDEEASRSQQSRIRRSR